MPLPVGAFRVSRPAGRSRLRRLLKNLAAVGVGLVLVVVVEVVLRVVGYGPDNRLVVPSFTDRGRTVYTLNHQAAARFFRLAPQQVA